MKTKEKVKSSKKLIELRLYVAGQTPRSLAAITNLKKIYYPQESYTKRDVINFYDAVSGLLVPHIKDRPLSLKRYPDGIAGEYFFQKEAPTGAPEWLRTVEILTHAHGEEKRSGHRSNEKPKTDEGKLTRFVVIDDRAA